MPLNGLQPYVANQNIQMVGPVYLIRQWEKITVMILLSPISHILSRLDM